MIYTVTVNPALDYMATLEDFQAGKMNRATSSSIKGGGKGINVSKVLKELGHKSVCLGFTGGWTGRKLLELLEEEGLDSDFVHLKEGDTRINVKVQGLEETAINTPGPSISQKDLDALGAKVRDLKEGDWLVMSGSLANGMSPDFYCSLAEEVSAGVKVVLDCDGAALKEGLKIKPFLVKPNLEEMRALLGEGMSVREGAEKLQAMGAENVLVSKGAGGAELVLKDGSYLRCSALSIDKKNTVGAGDSMVAGFIAGYIEKGDFGYALKLGSAAGVGTSEVEGLADRRSILKCLDLLEGELNI